MTRAGYIADQLCPTHPEHGKTLVNPNGHYCPHAGHWPVDPKRWTKCFWTFSEWEELHQAEPTLPTKARKPK